MIERLPVTMGDRRAVLTDISPGAMLWLAVGGKYNGPCLYVRFLPKKFLIEVAPCNTEGHRDGDDFTMQVDPSCVWILMYVIQEEP